MRVFHNSEFGDLGVIEIDGKEYFPATACAKMLGYTNPHKAIYDHCRYLTKREVPHPQNPAKIVDMNFIPEGDLYRLIIRSKLPSAERFERWVFDEVLPTIRKQGGYMPDIAMIIAQTAEATVKAVMEQLVPLLLDLRKPERRIRHRTQGISALSDEVCQDVEDMILSRRYTFMGSGTTLLAAAMEGHDSVGCELSDAIYDMAAKRLQEH